MKLYCENGCAPPYKTRDFNRAPDETNCLQCGGRLQTGMERNAKKRASRTGGRLRESMAPEFPAEVRFREVVVSFPCFAKVNRPGHECRGRREAHHLVPKDFIRREYGFLDPDVLVAILFDPLIGAPACASFHAALEARTDFIYFDELEDDCIERCERVDALYRDRVPKPRSMLERLHLESPSRTEGMR